MQSRDFNELAGRIEGLGRAVMHLVAEMERIGALDGPAFADQLRGAVVVLGPKPHPVMVAAKVTLKEVANALDEARRWRAYRRQIIDAQRDKAAQAAPPKETTRQRRAG